MNTLLLRALVACMLFLLPNVNFGQTPNLGSTSAFALFTAAGAINNIGATVINNGDIGTDAGAFNGFPPGILLNGQPQVMNAVSAQAAIDVDIAYMQVSTFPCGPVLGVGLGNNQSLTPNTYCIGAASTLNGDLILDGQCNPNSVFIFKIDGALATGVNSNVILTNSASLCNVYWQINGAVALGNSSVFRGTILANGAISMLENATLLGRGLSREGAINLNTNIVDNDMQPTASVIMTSGTVAFCQGGSVILSGNCGGTWSTGATTPSITVSASGTYSVTTMNACGSAISNTIIVTVNPLPICNITGADFICQGQSTQLCAPAGLSSYLWSTGAVTDCIIVNAAGIYSVTITDANGCSSNCSKSVGINPLPICNITGADFICQGQSTQLCAPAGLSSYLWSTGAVTDCIIVNAAGIYSVTITDANGCSSNCIKSVGINPLPICNITGADFICQGQSTQLCAPAGLSSYLWSTGAVTDCIIVNAAGIYSVTITDANGCSSNCIKSVGINPLPICNITGADFICQGQSTQLCAPAGLSSYLWSTGAVTDCIIVNAAGIYSVTITDANGCSSNCIKSVGINPLPICNITGADFICQPGQSTQLCVAPGLASYLWSTGEITNCITINAAGTYSVTITDVNGCSSMCSKTVNLNPPPNCIITGDNTICLGQSSELCVPPGAASYLWSTGAITNCIMVSLPGIYSVTVTYAGGCSSVCSETVIVNQPPICTITGDDIICQGESTQLCTPPGAANYLWSTGAITNCITVSLQGIYSVTVTDINGCSSVCNKNVIVNQPPICTITGNDIICQGQSTQLCTPPGAASYLWSTGAITNCITVSLQGIYSVTVTDINGCSSVCNKNVIVNQPPICTITGNDIICQGQSTQLCTPPGAASYLWSTGAITNCITVSLQGIYSVTVTDINGCSSVCNENVIVNQPPICTITGNDIICQGQSTQLCTPPGAASYLWSTGAITNCITVSLQGIYSVTVTDINGCSSVCNKNVIVNQPPICTITGNDIICQGQSTQLCTPPGAASYLWSTGAITNCITVSLQGIYSVTVTDINGCSSVCNKNVIVNQPPICTITGNDIICQGQSTQLCTPPGAASYLWSTGAITNCITVSLQGIYSVTVTDINGCSSVCNKNVIVNQPPICTITGNDIICLGQTTQLCTPPGAASYLWSTGAITNCITVSLPGLYSVTVTDINGCSSVCSETVIVNQPPICTITGDDIICLGQTTQLCTPPGAASYLWSTGAITNCITVSLPGIYSVTVTDINGCSSVCSETVIVNQPPICTITGNTIICQGQTTQLCTPPGAASYLWSTGAITNCIMVSLPGIYSVTVTDINGCSSVCNETVIDNPPPICTITGNDIICQGQTTQLCTPPGAVSYLWSTGAITNCITVSLPGIYSVTVTYLGGCTSVCNKTVIVNLPPICTITGNDIICQGQSTQLCTPPGAASYLWSTGAITNCITVSLQGIYSVTVTDINGCSSVCNKTVIVNQPPICTITGNTIICQGQTTELCTPPGAANYLWSTGAITNCITVSLPGIYSVTVTDINGCSSVCSETVIDNPPPICTITGDDIICLGQTTQLCTPPGAASYLWSTGAITNCITVSLPGLYSVTITYLGGCSSVCSETVIVNQPPICTITGDDIICQGQTTQLCTPPGAASYLWSTGAITNCITVSLPGIYSVTVTDINGCSSVCSETVIVNQPPICTITGDDIICLGQSTELCTPPGAASYLWSTGAITNCITVSLPGIYSVTVTDINGCSSVCSETVIISPPPICTITGDDIICQGQTTQLCTPPGAASYLWSTGAITNCITVSLPGIYSVTVTDINGCSSVCSETVIVNQPPICTITGNTIICQGQTTQLCTPPGAANYLWSTGAITNCITVSLPGIYSVTVTDINGCSSVCSETVIDNPPPICTITGDDIICLGQTTQLCTPPGAASYLWSTGAITNCITVSLPGLYSVTITYLGGCSSVCSETVIVNQPPICTITGDDIICLGQTTQLCTPPGAANYLWSTGAITNCITVSLPGIYSVTVTDINGCSSVCSETVIVNQPPICTITGGNFLCQPGQTTQLCTSPGAANYLWSTGAITNCITVSLPGIYSVTVTDINGCSSVCSKTVILNQPPICTITGGNFLCQPGQTTQLCTPPGAANYLWSTGAITNCITVSLPGIYSVTVTDINGCSSVCSKTVILNQPPICTITGGNFLCQPGQTTQLCTSPGAANYLWSTGAITNCITVSLPGIYSVTVTDINGCSSVCSETVIVNQPPICTITGGNFLCQPGQTTQLCTSPGAANYLWSTGAITNCITVSLPGIYSVTVTDINGCSSVCSKTVILNQPPICTITGGNFLCQPGQTTQLCTSPGAANYLWSTGAITNCITVSLPGIYSVTVTDINGCSSVCSETVIVNQPPICTITGGNFLCQPGQTTQLCTSPGAANYLWSTGAITNCITVSLPGIYSVTVTDINGCSSVCSETVILSPPPICTITGDDIICQGESTQLCTPPGAASYLWSTGAITNCITVSLPGIYSVTVTDINGCSSVCSETVILSPPPICTITGDDIICQGESTQLCTPPGAASYLWSTGAITNCIIVSLPGIYSVTVTDINGCSSVCSETVILSPPPICTITGDDIICQGESTQLCTPPGAASYLWSTGAITNCITVSLPGIYSVTVTDINGCSSVCSETVILSPPPICTITGDDCVCPGQTTQLCTPPGAASYLWSTGAITNCINVSLPGIYSVTVTNINGCTSVCSKSIINVTPPVINCPADVTIECDGSILPAITGIATATNNCNLLPTIVFNDVILPGLCPNEYAIARTFTATNICGIGSSCIQTLVVEDTIPPGIICPPDMTVECGNTVPPFDVTLVITSDNCGGTVTVTHLQDIITNQVCDNSFILTRMYMATDACGNTSTCTQIITVFDNTPPVIIFIDSLIINGDTLTVQCFGQDPMWDLPFFDEGSIEATDSCAGEVNIEFNQYSQGEGNCEDGGFINLYRLSWIATDACGNMDSVFISLALVDTIAPVIFGVPADISVNCDEIPPPPDSIFATDECLCACVLLMEETLVTRGCLDGQVIQRTWSAKDRCGNQTTATQTITLIDNTGPSFYILQVEIEGIADGTILNYTCEEGGIPAFFGNLSSVFVLDTSSCGNSYILSFEVDTFLTDNCEEFGYMEQRTYHWVAIDDCANMSSFTIIARLTDNKAPALMGVPDLMTCINDPLLSAVTATDDCGQPVVTSQDINVQNPCGNGMAVRRIYQAVDNCGNVARDTVFIIPNDQTAPVIVFTNPIFTEMGTGEILNTECATLNGNYTSFGVGDVSVSDACIGGSVTFTETLLTAGNCLTNGIVATIELRWTATDLCGNSDELIIIANILDETGPVFVNFIPEISIGCNAAMPVNLASDNCGTISLMSTVDSIIPGDCIFEYDIQSLVTATDLCGNSTTQLQTIHVGNGSGPIFEGIEEVICEDMTIPLVTAFDPCAGVFVEVTMQEDTLDIVCDGMVIERTWSAVDACGNISVRRQRIILQDTIPPEFIIPVNSFVFNFLDSIPNVIYLSQADLLFKLANLDSSSVFVADDCDYSIIVVFTVDTVYSENCIDGYFERRTYTWTATDACGNTATVSFVVDIVDDIPPVFIIFPLDITVVCEGLPPVLPVFVEDPAQPVTVVFSETIVPGAEPGTFIVTRTWTATDACGNVSVYIQTITWIPDTFLECNIIVPAVVECNSHGVLICADNSGGTGAVGYHWEIVGLNCFIQGNPDSSCILIYIGFTPVKLILTVTDSFGCVSMCTTTIRCVFSLESAMAGFPEETIGATDSGSDMSTPGNGFNPAPKEYLQQLNLYPNPANGSVNLSFESFVEHEVEFRLINFLGEVILQERISAQKGLNTHRVDVSQIPEGSYLMQVLTEREIHTKVIVILRND